MSARPRAQRGPSLEERDDYQRRQQEREFKQEKEQQKLQRAFNQQGNLSTDWMEDLLGTDDLTDGLQENTVKKIQGMLNKQMIIANLTEAETHDRKYKLEVMKHKIFSEHPPQESRVTGKMRAFLYDDPQEALRPLTAHERNQIDQIITALQNMITRSRGGFERKQQQTSIAKTEQESEKRQESSGGLLSSPFS